MTAEENTDSDDTDSGEYRDYTNSCEHCNDGDSKDNTEIIEKTQESVAAYYLRMENNECFDE